MSRSVESSVLLQCTNICLNVEVVDRLRQQIRDGGDWSELLRLAIPHGLLPLISRNLSAHAADITPAQTLAQLDLYRRRVESRNRAHAIELVRVMDRFSRAKIRALPFKGPTLAMAAYRDLSLREFHDLDIFVNAPDLPVAGDVLRAAGYRADSHFKGMANAPGEDKGPSQCEFFNPANEILLELHDELQSRHLSFSPRFDEVWERRSEVSLEGTAIASLCPEDLLMTLSVHGSKHLWRRLNWVVDVAGLVNSNPDLDYASTFATAARWRCRRMTLSALMLAGNLYEMRLPQLCEQELRRHAYTQSTVTRIQRHIIGGIDHRTVTNFASEMKHHAQSSDHVSDRMRTLWSYANRISKVDEAKMTRSMPAATRTLYQVSRAVRAFIGAL